MFVDRKLAISVPAALIVAVLVGSLITHRVRAKEPVEKVSGAGIPAAVATVTRGTMSNSFSVAGEFVPYQEVELHAKVAGYIKKINVDIGDRVRAGQVLAVLEVPELNAQVTGADADVKHSRQEILRSQSELARAKANHDALHTAAERLLEVSKTQPGLIAQQELDDATAKDRASEAQIDAAKSALAAAEERLASAQASKEQVSAMQEYSRIVAPFDGVVTWRFADTGSLIQAGTQNSNALPVVKVAEVRTLRLRVPVPESFAGHVGIGTRADVRIQATGEHFPGTVARLTDSFDRATRTMQVEIDVPNPKNKLSPGMFADVSLQVANRPDVLKVPVQALSRENNKITVLVVNSQNRVEQREIRTGLEEPDYAEVTAGLNSGDRVIVGSTATYRPGQLVTPKQSSMLSGGAE